MKGTHFRWLTISDIHFGARTTTAEELVREMEAFFENFSDSGYFTTVDLITFAGDVWDNSLALASEVPGIVFPFFFRMFDWAAAHNIVIRFMEGTPKHDRRQTETLTKVTAFYQKKLDVKYVSELSIERHEGLGIDILYVPDECRTTAKRVEEDIDKLLAELQIQQVDIAVMHGVFKYQLGNMPMTPKVNEESYYLNKVRYYISIGHIHTHSQYSRIVAQGSFGRLSHGQEEAKGGVIIDWNDRDGWSHHFVENKLAKSYVSLKVKNDLESALEQIAALTRKLRAGSYIELDTGRSHPILSDFKSLSLKFPGYYFSKKAEKAAKKKAMEHTIDYRAIVLNEKTLNEAVITEAASRFGIDAVQSSRLSQLLTDLQ